MNRRQFFRALVGAPVAAAATIAAGAALARPTYSVGEFGTETFVPTTPGRIIPAGRYAPGSPELARLIASLERAMKRYGV